MYRCAIVGVSGGRARGHAEAFRLVPRGRLVAVSTRTRENLDEFADAYGVEKRYTDYEGDVRRREPGSGTGEHAADGPSGGARGSRGGGVRSVLIEKPIAVQGEDYRGLLEFSRRSGLKVAVNHQLHFHPRRQALQRFVSDGHIGEVHFVEASSGMNLAYQGTHSLQASAPSCRERCR